MVERSKDGSGSGFPEDPRQLEHALSLIESAPQLIFLKDTSSRYLFVNRTFERACGKSKAELYGGGDEQVMSPESAAKVVADERRVLETGEVLAQEETLETNEGVRHFASVKVPVRGRDGELIGVGAFITEITEQKQRLLAQQEMIETQRDALRELSTPLLPIGEGVLAMPLVGVVDPERARQIIDNLLHGITTHRAHTAILDVTGIRLIDADVAAALIQAARAARLVGARVVLTGISPEIAQTLVSLEADLTGITTLGTLASGIAFALGS
jgi:rsbT co-antagonist protein RsbR